MADTEVLADITPDGLSAMLKENDCSRLQECFGSLEAPPDFEKCDSDGYVPVHLAAILAKSEAMKLLLSKGADVNIANLSGYTGLHLSAAWGHLETLKVLVEAGANPALKNCHEECAYDIALRYGRMQCAEYLEAAEIAVSFKALITGAREILGDSERISGRWNKDDKAWHVNGAGNKVTALCKEKWDWLLLHPDAAGKDITDQQDDFDNRMEPYMNKLQT